MKRVKSEQIQTSCSLLRSSCLPIYFVLTSRYPSHLPATLKHRSPVVFPTHLVHTLAAAHVGAIVRGDVRVSCVSSLAHDVG
eukprot:4094961-Pleurochrysis_carterae.AAC.2